MLRLLSMLADVAFCLIAPNPDVMFSYLKIRRISKMLGNRIESQQEVDVIEDFLERINVQYSVADSELKNIPRSGPFIVLANHPFGFLDSLVLLSIFGKDSENFKVVANIHQKEMQAISSLFIEPGDGFSKGVISQVALAQCDDHLSSGKSLALFPACHRAGADKGGNFPWHDSVVDLVLGSGLPVVPVYFYGANSAISRILDVLPTSLRSWAIPAELVQKENSTIKLRIGKVIDPADLKSFGNRDKASRYLRACLFALGSQLAVKKFFKMNFKLPKRADKIIDAVPVPDIEAELEVIRQDGGLLQSKGNYDIYLGRTELMPSILRELGRLREVTFREVGEGTNQQLDVDGYDLYYNHLFVWDRDERCIIGAYRLGRGNDIIKQHGAKGFYVTSLFTLDEPLIPVLEKTLELGRSFVVKKYQQKPLPLFLLWQGILCFLRDHKEYQYLMGPVSISNDFSVFSKDLLIAFIKKNYFDHELAKHVHPHQEFVVQTNPEDIDVILERSNDLQQLDKFISSVEPNYLKIPVLLKQYIKQNAKIIAFNVDPLFNFSLDGLMILDLNDVPEDTYEMLQSR